MRTNPRLPQLQRPSTVNAVTLLTMTLCLLVTGCGRSDDPFKGHVPADPASAAVAPGAVAVAVADEASAPPVVAQTAVVLRPSSAGASGPAGPDILLSAHGGRCDGRFDNSAALGSAIKAARESRATVRIPRGVCAYGDVLRLDSSRLRGEGPASVLSALDWQRAAIFMSGDGSEVRDLTLTGQIAPSRQAAWETTRITLMGATRFVIDGVTLKGSSAAGIQTAQGSRGGRITHNHIQDTLADAIHLTDRAARITVEDNVIENAGDDGIAVVSYRSDGAPSQDITARRNTVRNSLHGRQMSVVGGVNVLYEDNQLENSGKYACIYIAQEASYKTFGAEGVLIQRNRLRNCGSLLSSHAAIMVFNDGESPNNNITLRNNVIEQKGQTGIRVAGPLNRNVRLEGNTVQGALRSLQLEGDGVTVVQAVPAESAASAAEATPAR